MKLALKILIHTIFWTVFLLFTIMASLVRIKNSGFPTLSNIAPHLMINFIWAAIIFYLFYGHFIKYFENRQFVKYLIFSTGISIVLTFIFLLVHRIINAQFNVLNYKIFAPPIIGTFILAQCGSLVRGFENWFTNIKLKAELENRNLKNELELLKSQINPHFLFNTLNNIDSFIHTSPDEASRSLITLSNLLRYMIYDTKSDYVPLTKEIEYINNFIQLQRIRYPHADSIRLSVSKDCTGILIAPMLLIPFIENAFKYSIDNGETPIIDISMICKKEELKFACMNFYKADHCETGRPGGVGLENVKRRLELLYPGKHYLLISKNNNIFKVDLKIQLL
jgi:two-component system, LytTR family, sensor kinase